MKPIIEKIKKCVSPLWEKVKARREKKVQNWITYYPFFSSEDELTSHYYRACWYLPKVEGKCERVLLFKKVGSGVSLGERPGYMCAPRHETSHIRVLRGMVSYFKTLYRSRVIMVWKNEKLWLFTLLKLLGVKSVYINTHDPEAKEYGAYCGLFWKHLLDEEERQLVIQESYERFCKVADKINQRNYHKACVFGTGPSLEDAYEFDFNGCLTIVCNSVVQNSKLLNHISPEFVCAGDVVSHLGVSRYAKVFRDDLIEALKERDLYFVTTATFGYLLILNHPELREKTILIEQTVDRPNYNLIQLFGLPRLDSTLNIHMLPIASTFTDEIFILGCDGKSEKRDNEDFWAHARGAQYDDLVDTGHECHPTFDINRQRETYNKHLDSVYLSISSGEMEYGKSYNTLKQSNIIALKEKTIPRQWTKNQNDELIKIDSFPSPEVKSEQHNENFNLDLKANVSKAVLDLRQQVIKIKGWALSNPSIDKIEVFCGEEFYGRAVLGIRRPDIYKKYPEYGNERSGFSFLKKLVSKPQNHEVIVVFYYKDKVVGSIRKETQIN